MLFNGYLIFNPVDIFHWDLCVLTSIKDKKRGLIFY